MITIETKKYNLLILHIFLLCFFNMCQNAPIKEEQLYLPSPLSEYSVLNEVFLKLIDPAITLCDYSKKTLLPKVLDKEQFDKLYTSDEQSFILKELKRKGLNLAQLNLSDIKIQIVKDSMLNYKELKSIPLNINRLNSPKHVILIKEKDNAVFERNKDFKWFYVSRVFINEKETEAEFEYGFRDGMLYGHGVKILIKKQKNEEWKIAEKQITWIS